MYITIVGKSFCTDHWRRSRTELPEASIKGLRNEPDSSAAKVSFQEIVHQLFLGQRDHRARIGSHWKEPRLGHRTRFVPYLARSFVYNKAALHRLGAWKRAR